jgi:hypothetical protein
MTAESGQELSIDLHPELADNPNKEESLIEETPHKEEVSLEESSNKRESPDNEEILFDDFQFPNTRSTFPSNNDLQIENGDESFPLSETVSDHFEFPDPENVSLPIESAAQNSEFQFSFDDFPDNSNVSFTFDVNEEPFPESESEILFEKFIGLIGNPCFVYFGKPFVDLFRHEDPTDSIETAFSLLVRNERSYF